MQYFSAESIKLLKDRKIKIKVVNGYGENSQSQIHHFLQISLTSKSPEIYIYMYVCMS